MSFNNVNFNNNQGAPLQAIDRSKIPVSVQAQHMPQVQAPLAGTAGAPKKTAKKEHTVQHKRCELIQNIVMGNDPFGLYRAKALIIMCTSDITQHQEYVIHWIQRGRDFSLKSKKAILA